MKQESLSKKKLGLREVEQFSLGLRFNFKSEKLQNRQGRPVEGVIEAAMKVKIRDERENRRELEMRKEEMRKKLMSNVKIFLTILVTMSFY